jgi:2-haloalkanoic acid dehalogenase type II
MRLNDFRALTFDCYGTLIDWETGLRAALEPLQEKSGKGAAELLEAFARLESAQEAQTPRMLYSDLLAEVHRALASELGVAMPELAHKRFGASVPDWPAFPDSAQALRYLKNHYQLVILSNVDRKSFAASNQRLGVEFDAVFTAEDIGSYKPDLANFRFMLQQLGSRGIPPDDILHTAQSLFHDHVPAKRLGLASAWIDRRHEQDGWGATAPAPEASYDFRFTSMAEMVRAHEAELETTSP